MPQADGLDQLDNMASSARKHRRVPPPKRAALPPQQAQDSANTTEEGEQPETASPNAQTATETAVDADTSPPSESEVGGRRARSRRGGTRQVAWTPDAKAVRAALTTYQAQLRKLDERRREVRKLARRIPREDLTAIVQRVAQDTDGNRQHLADAAGLSDSRTDHS